MSRGSGNIQSCQVETKVEKMPRGKPPAGKFLVFSRCPSVKGWSKVFGEQVPPFFWRIQKIMWQEFRPSCKLIPVKSLLQMYLNTGDINLWHIIAAILMSRCVCLYILLQPPLDLFLTLTAAMLPSIIYWKNICSW